MKENLPNVYTSGIFDLAHAGHFESINRILELAPDCNLLIGVCSDKYCESYKRKPIRDFNHRVRTLKEVYKYNSRVKVIEDPLVDKNDIYKESFYDDLGIIGHYQGDNFDDVNNRIYEVMLRRNQMHFIGRSELDSTTNIINSILSSSLTKLGGDTNTNYHVNNSIIKKVEDGDIKNIDFIYNQLRDKKLFNITHYMRIDNLVIYDFIPGEVRPHNFESVLLNVVYPIQESGLEVYKTLKDLFNDFDFRVPDNYDLKLDTICHLDLVYPNVVSYHGKLTPIDFECCGLGPDWWDISCYIVSVYLYSDVELFSTFMEITDFNVIDNDLNKLALVAMYWKQWSKYTGKPYFNNKLESLIRTVKSL